jgi:hypothetical protein
MNPKRIALIIGALLFLTAARAGADEALPTPHVRLTSGPGQLLAPNGKTYFLPVGTHILDGTSFEKIEDETRRLQTQEIRLKAENESLKKSLGGPGWGTVLIVALGATALGFTVNHFVE